MALSKIIQDRLDRLDSVPDQFNDRVRAYQTTLFNEILDILEDFDRVDGVIVVNSKNIQLITELSPKLEAALAGEKYIDAVRYFASEFDRQGELIFSYLAEEFDVSDATLAAQQLAVSKRQAVNLLLGQSLKTPILNPIETQISEAVFSGSKYTDLVKTIRTFTEGDEEVLGVMHRYAKQISYDAFALADRSYTQTAIDGLGVEFYRYQGGVIKDTRDFCAQRNGNIFHAREIEQWAGLDWQGKYKGTTEGTIFVYGGGYNCRHSFVPVSEINVPVDVLNRAMSLGFYDPSPQTKELLGIS